MSISCVGSKVLYVARAQKKAEREHILRRQFEEKRKEQMLKFKVVNSPYSSQEVSYHSILFVYFLIYLTGIKRVCEEH